MMKPLILILVLMISNCNQKKKELVLPLNDNASSKIDFKINKETLFSLENFPEFSKIIYHLEANHTIIPEYFETEVRKKGKNSEKEYGWTGTANCSEFVPKKNLFRFRFSGEDFDLHLKFLYKDDHFFYLTNSDQTKIIKLKILNRFIPKGANQEYIDSFELLSETNKLITSARPTDFESYAECIQWAKETSEAIRNTSPDIFD